MSSPESKLAAELAELHKPLEDPDYRFLYQPTPQEIDKSRALLAVPGRFSVQMLADILAGARMAGARAQGGHRRRETILRETPGKLFIDWWHALGHDCGIRLPELPSGTGPWNVELVFCDPATQAAWERFQANGNKPFELP